MVTGAVNAADSISVRATNIAVSPDAVIQTLSHVADKSICERPGPS